jgi:hypothetical protein
MNRQRLIKRAASGIAAAALSIATLAVLPAPAAHAATLCQSDCIGTVTAAAGLDRVRLTFATTANTKVAVSLRRADGTGSTTTWGSATFTNSFDISFSSLPAGVAYRYQIIATDYSGGSWQETGYFSTSVRRITVTPTKLVVDKDSDDFSAGDLVGAIHLYGSGCDADVRALAPLSKTTTTQVSSGGSLTIGAGAAISCEKVPASVTLETNLADNDVDSGDSCAAYWPWRFSTTSWYATYGSNTCADWNNGGSTLTFPLATSVPVGSTTVNFTHKSKQESWDGWDLALTWTLTGTVTYAHVKPAGALPATTTGPVSTQVNAIPSDGSVNVTWSPISIPGVALTGYRLSHRVAGGSWTSQDLVAGTLSKTITGLTNGTAYEVKVAALDSAKFAHGLDEASATPVSSILPTTVTGWTTSQISMDQGLSMSVPITVTSGGAPRAVQLQARTQGSATWATYWNGSTDAAGKVTLSLPADGGVKEHRLVVPATASYAGYTSVSRTVTTMSTITGFATTPFSGTTGTSIPVTVTVTPGAGRELLVVRRSAGGSWVVADTVVADGSGVASFDIPVETGTVEWAVQAAFSVDFGGAATTDIRTVTGTVAASLAATTLTGWTTAPATLRPGTVVKTLVGVTTAAKVRTLRLQYRLPGTTVWKTEMTMQAEPTGKATVAYKVKAGRVAWRLVVDPTAEHAGTVSALRTITAKSAVTGFATKKVTRAKGTILKDAITVSPGAKRTVLVQYRKAGTSTWKTYRTVVASSTGALTVRLKAFKGRHVWRAYVVATAAHGSAAASGLRTVIGR